MKKLVLILTALSVISFATTSFACSVKVPTQAEAIAKMKELIMEDEAVAYISGTITSITPVVEPSLDFSAPVEADCSGLYSGYWTGAFRIDAYLHESMNVLVTIHGFGLDGKAIVTID